MINLRTGSRRWLSVAMMCGALLWAPVPLAAHEPAATATPVGNAATTVKGIVTDESGEPLIGASVIVKGAKTGAATDADGQFSISCKPSDTLVFSYIGYTSREFKASALPATVTLASDNKMLDEVIVVGYGTTTRKSAVSAVDQVKADMFENRPVANMTQALQGASPSLIVQRKSQNPTGESTNFNIRGISTLNDNTPLFVIDGLVADQGAFNRLNPMDIENISVLKDAGSAAIYGSRSANGVVLVTTKGGRKGEATRVRFSGMMGWEKPHHNFRPLQGYQNATLRNLANTNVGANPVFTPDQIRDLYEHRSEENWFADQIFQTALQQSYTVGISGGTDKTTYMVSVGYYDQGSNYVNKHNYGVQRYHMRSNITTELGRLKVSAIMAFTRNNSRDNRGGSIEIDATRVPTYYYYRLKDEQGRYLVNDVLGEFNPLGQLEASGWNKYRNNDFTGNLSADFRIIEGLKLRGVLGVNVNDQMRFSRGFPVQYYYADGSARALDPKGNITQNWNSDFYLINSQILLDFNRKFGIHSVNALFGATNESSTWSANDINKNYVDPDLGTSTAVTTGEPGNIYGATTVDNSSRTSITSLLGRAGYNFDERYYAEFNFRYDGASKFHRNYRWGFFPSASLAWRLTQEQFMQSYAERVGDLKLRASYGVLGSQAVGNYDRFTVYSVYDNNYAFNNTVVSGAGFNLGKDDLTWEKTHTLNVGVDATFLNNTLRLTADYFHKRTNDILMTPLVPGVFGTGMPRDNIGRMQNQGWELALAYNLNHGDFRHSFNFNLGDTWNKVLSFPGKESIGSNDEINWIIREGEAINSYYGYRTAGLFQSWDEIEASAIPVGAKVQPGDLKFVDRNSDGVIDSKDRFILGNGFPRYTFGFNYGLEWRGFDLSMFLQGVGKRDMMLRGELIEPFHANYSYNIYKHQLDFWTPTNTDARWPRLSAAGSTSNRNNFGNSSDIYMLDGRYLRLKNLVVGYTIPRNLTRVLGMQRCRVYANGQDILTFSRNSFIDPESSEFGSNMGRGGANSGRNYPSLRYWGFGLDIEF